VLKELLELDRRSYVTPAAMVNVYIGLGDKDQAFAWLEKAYQRRSIELFGLKFAPLGEDFRADPRFADLLRRMQTVATQSNLTIKSFKPANPVTKQLHSEWPINLELDGTYHNLAIFFDRVSKFTRIVNISGLDVKGKEKADPNSTISASCVATTFVLLDQKAAGKGGAANGRGAKPPATKGT